MYYNNYKKAPINLKNVMFMNYNRIIRTIKNLLNWICINNTHYSYFWLAGIPIMTNLKKQKIILVKSGQKLANL